MLFLLTTAAVFADTGLATEHIVVSLERAVALGEDGMPTDTELRAQLRGAGVSSLRPVFPAHNKRKNPAAYDALGMGRHYRVTLAHPTASPRLLADHLAGLGGVHVARTDSAARGFGVVPDDPSYELYQWGLHGAGDPGIDAEAAWELTTGSADIVVAVIDSGVDLTHEELVGNLWANAGEIADNGVDDDGNGFVDDVAGWDFVGDDNDPDEEALVHGVWEAPCASHSVGDPYTYSHGTPIAGIIAAEGDNAVMYAGVCWSCTIMPLRVLEWTVGVDGPTTVFPGDDIAVVASAVTYAVDNGADIINLSLGAPDAEELLEDAIAYAEESGVVVVAAVGNTNDDTENIPATYPTTIAVGATRFSEGRWVEPEVIYDEYGIEIPFDLDDPLHRETAARGSNTGEYLDLVAPGAQIWALDPVGPTGGECAYLNGTSYAAPLVSGTVALMLARNASLTPPEIRAILRAGAMDLRGFSLEDTDGFDTHMGYGRLNAYRSVFLADRGPFALSLDCGRLEPGAETTCTVTGAADGERVYLARGVLGEGECTEHICADITDVAARKSVLSAGGVAEIRFDVPADILDGLAEDELPLEITIQAFVTGADRAKSLPVLKVVH